MGRVRPVRGAGVPIWALALVAALTVGLAGTAHGASKLRFKSVKVDGRPGDGNLPWAEPRIAIGPDGWSWIVTNRHQSDGSAAVFGSRDGLHWKVTPGLPAGQTSATPDVDILAMPTGRLLASELDDAGINFPTSWSDDHGKSWTASTGSTQVADQDRQWFAYGPKDPTTHKNRVYLLFHNLASGQAQHNMFVATSTDGGQSWTDSLAVDDANSGQIVSMQIASGGLDRAGNVYIAYPEGPLGRQFPDYSGAGVRYRWAPPAKDGDFKWSKPKTLVSADKKAPGNVLVHMQAGDPGRLIAEYWRGQSRAGKKPVWHMYASMTTNGLRTKPKVVEK